MRSQLQIAKLTDKQRPPRARAKTHYETTEPLGRRLAITAHSETGLPRRRRHGYSLQMAAVRAEEHMYLCTSEPMAVSPLARSSAPTEIADHGYGQQSSTLEPLVRFASPLVGLGHEWGSHSSLFFVLADGACQDLW